MKKYILALCLSVIFAIFVTYSLGLMTSEYRIRSTGSIVTIGVNVYSDYDCTEEIDMILWGKLKPNSSTNTIVYVKSTSNIAITLAIYGQNWMPPNCPDYLSLTASPNNFQMQPLEVKQVTLTLNVAYDIEGIENFSLDIIFYGRE